MPQLKYKCHRIENKKHILSNKRQARKAKLFRENKIRTANIDKEFEIIGSSHFHLHFFITQKLDDAFKMQYVNYYRANRHFSIYISYVHHPIKKSEYFRKSPCVSFKSIITLLSSICPPIFFLFRQQWIEWMREENKNVVNLIIKQQKEIC